MIVRRACYRNFRNITDAKIDFSPGVNVLYGGNAQGKTSAIEGIYICSSGRSHRTVHDNELIMHKESFGTVKIDFEDMIAALKEVNYKGYMTLEADAYLVAFAPDDLHTGVKNMADTARRLANMFEA